MHSRLHLAIAAGLLLLAGVPSTATASLGPARASRARKSSSWWLKAGEARQDRGDFAGAGKAYSKALDLLSEKKKRANVGARTAMLSSDAYWMAFERDARLDLENLRASIQVLERWMKLIGPAAGSIPAYSDVERMASRLRSLHDALDRQATAIREGDLDGAARHHKSALEPLSRLDGEVWPIGARSALRVAGAHVDAYDDVAVEVEGIESGRPTLETAQALLVSTKEQRPEDDDSEEAARIDTLLAGIQTRLDEGEQRLADAARAEEQRRQAEERARQERKQREEAEQARAREEERRQAAAAKAKRQRRAGIVLLSSGITATAAGAGLLGEAVVFGAQSDRLLDAEAAKATEAMDDPSVDFDTARFEADTQQYQDEVQRRTTIMLTSGSILAAGGIGMAAAGIVLFVRGRRAANAGSDRRARLVPSVGPTGAHLTLLARF